MGLLTPTEEQAAEMVKLLDQCPLVMVNLLKFKPDGGEETYRIYSEKFTEIMEPLGVEVLFRGECALTAIGNQEWDEVIVVRYSSPDAFEEMQKNPAYQEAFQYRLEALEDSRLFITKEQQQRGNTR